MKNVLLLLVTLLLSACATSFKIPDTVGDPKNAQTYGYHPLDPLPVVLTNSEVRPLALLPDETMRIAIGTVAADGSISFGPAKIGSSGNSYIVVLDYIKFGTKSLPVLLSERHRDGSRTATLTSDPSQANRLVPVYVGVGLRLTANVVVRKGHIDLGNLFALGAAAKAERITGTMVIQTLGVSGPEVSGLIPMPSAINESTIQNSILSLASIKAKLYDDETQVTPRVVGVYNSLGGGEDTINGLISSLLQQPLLFPGTDPHLSTR